MVNSNCSSISYRCEIFSHIEVKNRHFEVRTQHSDCRPLADERPAIST